MSCAAPMVLITTLFGALPESRLIWRVQTMGMTAFFRFGVSAGFMPLST